MRTAIAPALYSLKLPNSKVSWHISSLSFTISRAIYNCALRGLAMPILEKKKFPTLELLFCVSLLPSQPRASTWYQYLTVETRAVALLALMQLASEPGAGMYFALIPTVRVGNLRRRIIEDDQETHQSAPLVGTAMFAEIDFIAENEMRMLNEHASSEKRTEEEGKEEVVDDYGWVKRSVGGGREDGDENKAKGKGKKRSTNASTLTTTSRLDSIRHTKAELQKKAVEILDHMRIWAQRAMMNLYVNELRANEEGGHEEGALQAASNKLSVLGKAFTRALLVTGKVVRKRRIFNMVVNNSKATSLKGRDFVPVLSVPLSYLWSVDASTTCRLNILEMRVFMARFFCVHSHPELPWWLTFMEELATKLADTLATAWSWRLQRKAAAGLAIFASSKASALLLLRVDAHKTVIDKVFQGVYGRDADNQRAIVAALRAQDVEFKDGGRVDSRVEDVAEGSMRAEVEAGASLAEGKIGTAVEEKEGEQEPTLISRSGRLSVYLSALRTLVLLCTQTVEGETEMEVALTSYIETWVDFPLAKESKGSEGSSPSNPIAALFLWIANDVS